MSIWVGRREKLRGPERQSSRRHPRAREDTNPCLGLRLLPSRYPRRSDRRRYRHLEHVVLCSVFIVAGNFRANRPTCWSHSAVRAAAQKRLSSRVMDDRKGLNVAGEFEGSTADDELWSLRIVIAKTGLSRSMLYAYIADGSFPTQRRLGRRRVAWFASEVRSWILSRPPGGTATH